MLQTEIERRASVCELRAKGRRLEGLAAVFNTEAKLPGFVETIRPGAFTATLSENRDILALVDHDASRLLGRTKSGTLRLAEGARGLEFSVDIPDTSDGNDVLALAERNDLGGMSFSFSATDEHWNGERRELRAVTLHEVSVVSAWPAYPGTLVQARSRGRVLSLPLGLARRRLSL